MGRGNGVEETGKKTPQRKIIGKRKKLDMVIASKTSSTLSRPGKRRMD